MAIATISSKGQVTLPSELRRRLGLKPGDRIWIAADEQGIVIRPTRDFLEYAGSIPGPYDAEGARQEMMEYVARRQKGER